MWLCFMLTLFTPAQASLGDRFESIENDRAQFHGKVQRAESHSAYTIHVIQTDALTLKEYISTANGKIFAISWMGNRHPDLTQLLGTYFAEYARANQKVNESKSETRKMRGRMSRGMIQAEHVSVEKSGHLRGSRGKAYVIDLFPVGVTSDEIP